MKKSLSLAALLLIAPLAHAQERTAAGALETQMTWSALSSKVSAVDAKVDGVNTKLEQAILCGKEGKLYAPGAAGADSRGCLVQEQLTSIIACNNQDKVYAPAKSGADAAGCVQQASSGYRWSYAGMLGRYTNRGLRNLVGRGTAACNGLSNEALYDIGSRCADTAYGAVCSVKNGDVEDNGDNGSTFYTYVKIKCN